MTKRQSTPSPAAHYLALADRQLQGVRQALPALTRLAQQMSVPILDGGNLFPPPVAEYWPSEFSGRAGGLMGIKIKDYKPTSSKDVAFFALPGNASWDPTSDPRLQELMQSKAQLYVIGQSQQLASLKAAKRFAGFTGGIAPGEGLYGLKSLRPLAPLWQLEQLLRGWVTAGEFVAACTRAGKMPTLWMSIWLEGAGVRNASFIRYDNLREVWSPAMFHSDRYVPPLKSGYVGRAFLDELGAILNLLGAQLPRLARAGRWMAQAKQAGQTVHMVAVGHSYPMLLDLPKDLDYPVLWGPTNSNLQTAIPAQLGKGDVAIHFGYAPVDVVDVMQILDRGVRFIYTSPYGRPAALRNHPNLLWLDLPWRPADATVDIPGYSVRLLPASSSCHTMAYFAILCEMAQRMGWQ